jgi:hypothetical protein
MVRPVLTAVCLGLACALLAACPPPPTLDDPSPGQPDCGMLDPHVVLPAKLCPQQRQLMRDEGKPHSIRPGPAGGMTWIFEFHSGDVFGQRGGYRFYDFTPAGKLQNRRTEYLYQQEK